MSIANVTSLAGFILYSNRN